MGLVWLWERESGPAKKRQQTPASPTEALRIVYSCRQIAHHASESTRTVAHCFEYSLLVTKLLVELPAPGLHGARTVPYAGATVTLIFVQGGRNKLSGALRPNSLMAC
jgi:hypothetical protein